MFSDIIDNPQTRMLDFFCDYPRFDYNVSDIARIAKISRPTTYKYLEKLLKSKMIIKTRVHGNSTMYKLNTENDIIKAMLKIDFESASKEAKKLDKIEGKKHA